MFAQESVEDRAQETEPKTEDVYNKPLTKPIKISKLTQKNDLSKAFEPPAESLPYAVNSLRSTTTNDAPTLELEPKIVAFVQGLVERVKTTLFEMNPIATIGVVILFIGVSFLLKYASAYIHFSIERRLLTVAAVGIIGSILGLRLHLQKPVFANILQGCSVGLLFLTTYASFKVYGLLPPVVAFGL